MLPFVTNSVLNTKIAKSILGIAIERSIPKLANKTFYNWYNLNKKRLINKPIKQGEIFLFIDEFTNYYDVNIGIDCIELLTDLGYRVNITNHEESGRSFISKGVLDEAKKIADFNVNFFKDKISNKTPLVGIEPSAILTFRDEYLRLADDKKSANEIAKNTFTIEEFIKQEFDKNNIVSERFTDENQVLKIHGHCQQKSLSNIEPTFKMLSIPKNYKVTIINSGCCGMAGSFGYEKEHYQISMQIGEDTLFPKIRNANDYVIIVAAGTSCRHQIKDGTNKNSKHPISVLRQALK
jgi:Fe-S oxidoreductase